MSILPLDHGIFASSGAGAGGGVAGYIPGLFNGGFSTTVDKWAFPSDTRTTTNSLPAAGMSGGQFADSGVSGYKVGGYDSSWNRTQTTYKMTMPSDTWSTITNVAAVVAYNVGNANSGVAGYSSGGQVTGGTFASAAIHKLTFPSDSWSTLTAALSFEYNQYGGPMDNKGVACYIAGGQYKSGGSNFVTHIVQKLLVPSDSHTTTTVLSATNSYKGGCSNNAVAGYVFGGQSSGDVINKYAFPSDTRSTLTATVSDAYAIGGFSNSGVAGYAAGGVINSGSGTSTVYKIDFTTDASSTTNAISTSSYYTPGFSDQGVL